MKRILAVLLIVILLTSCTKTDVILYEFPEIPKNDNASSRIITSEELDIKYHGAFNIIGERILIGDLSNGEINIFDKNFSHIGKLEVVGIELKRPSLILFEEEKYIIYDSETSSIIMLDKSGKLLNEFTLNYKQPDSDEVFQYQVWDMEFLNGDLYMACSEPFNLVKMNLDNGDLDIITDKFHGSVTKINNTIYAADQTEVINEKTSRTVIMMAKAGINGIHKIEDGKIKKLIDLLEGIAPIDFIMSPDKTYIYSNPLESLIELDSNGDPVKIHWSLKDHQEFLKENNINALMFKNMYTEDYVTFYLVFDKFIVEVTK